MKRILIALALVLGIAAVAFATLNSRSNNTKKVEKKEVKKDCCSKHHCPVS